MDEKGDRPQDARGLLDKAERLADERRRRKKGSKAPRPPGLDLGRVP